VLVPAGTPRPVVEKIHAALVRAVSDDTVKGRMADAGVIATTNKSPEEFKIYLEADAKKWSDVIKKTGAKPE
jgi:tripartite-type tricarboxylate transporter receptor subunit TctC